jgi:hypothetical protein
MTEQPQNPQDPKHPSSEFSEDKLHREITELEEKSTTAARLFDIRRIIGGLFVLYGIIVTIAGFTASDASIDKSEGVNINLWTGLGMLALGLFFLAWLWLRPVAPPVDVERLVEERGKGAAE